MAIEIKVPTLGESITEATVLKWLKKEGETFEVDEPLVEIETEKITLEVSAPTYGILEAIKAKEGINVKINIIIGFPDETHKDILMTLWQLIKFSFAGAHDISISVFAPYPGSELYDDLIKKGVINHDNEYWQQLSFVDITKTKSYCENISSKSLLFYNWLGMILFYLSNYAFRPVRVYKTLRNLIIKKHESRGEDVLAQIIKRCSFTFKAPKKSVN